MTPLQEARERVQALQAKLYRTAKDRPRLHRLQDYCNQEVRRSFWQRSYNSKVREHCQRTAGAGEVIMLSMNPIGEPYDGKRQVRFDEEVEESGLNPGPSTLLYSSSPVRRGGVGVRTVPSPGSYPLPYRSRTVRRGAGGNPGHAGRPPSTLQVAAAGAGDGLLAVAVLTEPGVLGLGRYRDCTDEYLHGELGLVCIVGRGSVRSIYFVPYQGGGSETELRRFGSRSESLIGRLLYLDCNYL